jgi:hypothetical protein
MVQFLYKNTAYPVVYDKDDPMAKRKRTNNDLQNITQKTKDQVIRTPLNMYTDMYNKHTRVYGM